jgi:protein SCO1/2
MNWRVAWAVVLVGVAGCAREPETRTYQLSGQILAVRAGTQEVLIRHGDIVGFMPGMTMPFRVQDPALLEGRTAGDLVSATLNVGPRSAWISEMTTTGHAPLPDDAPAAPPAASGVELLAPGATVPDTPLRASDGATLSLADARGRATAVTFIYTRCPLPSYCPLMDRRFTEIQRRAAGDAVLSGRVSLVTISFDPAFDTPARLSAHAASLGADPAVWRFATFDEPAAAARFAAKFGVNVIREADGTITHNLRTLVVDPAGKVVSVHDGNVWTADELLADLRGAVGHP